MTQNQIINLVKEHGWIQHDFAKDLEQSKVLGLFFNSDKTFKFGIHLIRTKKTHKENIVITQLEPSLKFNLTFDELDGDYTVDDINFKIIK